MLKHLWKVNMLIGPKHCLNQYGSSFVIFFDDFERKSPGKFLYVKHFKSWDWLLTYWQAMTSILCLERRVFKATYSNAIISKWKKVFSIFFSISELFINFWKVWRKHEAQSWFVSEIMDSKMRGYLNTWKPRVRTLIHSQHIKGSETLLKSTWQCFCHIFWSLWQKISSKSSVLVVCEILRLFVHILTPDDKYCVSVKASV